MKNWIGLVGVLMLAGCADTHQLVRSDSGVLLNPADAVYIAMPEPGADGSEKYWNSGKQTVQALQGAFKARAADAGKIMAADAVQTLQDAKTAARASGARYLIYPVITQWEDHLTEWTGYPDFLGLKIDLVNVAKNGPPSSAEINARSGLATLCCDHPEDLLPAAVGEYVDSLYGIVPDKGPSMAPIRR